jgi:DNA repair exonuclease SbcCD ATPase subunit
VNRNKTLKLLEKKFVNLNEIGSDVVRGERRHKGASFGVYYFDFSRSLMEPSFNLEQFLKRNIAVDFYKNEGSLQWNYYLYFVVDSQDLVLLGRPRIAFIESERTFARKYVRDEAALDTELSVSLSESLSTSKQTQDIASRWVEELSNAGLSRIADPKHEYLPIIRDYLEGKASPTPERLSVGKAPDVPKGRFIERLNLGNFRRYPAERSHQFATVNLICGPNGAGKTSLLEAIELGICGGNRRQGGKLPANTEIKLQFSGDRNFTTLPLQEPEFYRTCDGSWYGGYYLLGNRLFENFARFNFFDTDAAVELSSEAPGKQIQAAINTLFLGRFANALEERMVQSRDRFDRDLTTTVKQLKTHRDAYKKSVGDLAKIREVKDTREALVEEIRTQAIVCRWRKISDRITLSAIESLQEKIASEAYFISHCIQHLTWMPKITKLTLQREFEEITEAVDGISATAETLEEQSRKLAGDKEQMELLQSQIDIINSLARYHEQESGLSLLGLGEKIETARVALEGLTEVASLAKGIDVARYETISSTVTELHNAAIGDVVKKRKSLEKNKRRLAEVSSEVNEVINIVQKIRGLGEHYCKLKPLVKNCPLCGTEVIDLQERLASSNVPKLAASLGELSKIVADEEHGLKRSETYASVLERMLQAEELYCQTINGAPRSVKWFAREIATLPEKVETQKSHVNKLIAAEKRLRAAGLREAELSRLLENAVDDLMLPRQKLIKPDLFQNLVIEKRDALTKASVAVKKGLSTQAELKEKIQQWYIRCLGQDLPKNPRTELGRRQSLVKDALASATRPIRAVEIGGREEFSSVSARLDAFHRAVGRIRESFKRVEERSTLEATLSTRVSESHEIIVHMEAREQRAKKALSKLDELLGESYKQSYLHEMQQKLKVKLVTLFTRIHAPHEFADIQFNGEVKVKRDSGTLEGIDRISTGQRAALALSIFLSMNSSVNDRSPWLLFDDPIAHVDDLNILSFLDILRDIVFLGDRQVFFATANPRLADLFTRKFECLGDQFRQIRLPAR